MFKFRTARGHSHRFKTVWVFWAPFRSLSVWAYLGFSVSVSLPFLKRQFGTFRFLSFLLSVFVHFGLFDDRDSRNMDKELTLRNCAY